MSAYIPNSGSVVAFQGTSPWVDSMGNASVITVGQGSIATVIIGGSILTSSTANQSVSGSVGIVGNPSISGTVLVNNGSVVAFQGTNPWTVTSSIVGGIFPVSGSVSAVVTNNVTVVSSIAGGIFPISGSVSAVVTNTNINVSGSVVAFLGNSTNASVITVGTAAANQSVSGTVGASIVGQLPAGTAPLGSVATLQGTVPWIISSVYGNVSGSIAGTYTSSTVATTVTGLAVMFKPNVSSSIMTEISPTWPLPITGAVAASISGTVATTLSGNPSISGTVLVNNGSVVAFQGTSPWVVNYQNSSVITVSSGSIAAVIIGGSVATATTNSSVMLLNGANVIGSVTALQGTNPWIETFSNSSIIAINAGSVVTLSQGSVITVLQSSSIIGVVTGSVLAIQSGTHITSVVSSTPSSLLTGASIYGQLPGGTAVLGSVAALQGTNPWVTVAPAGSVMAVSGISFAGSVLAGNTSSVIQQGTWIVSVVSTVPSSVLVGASIYGQLPAGTAMMGSVAALQAGTWSMPVTESGTWIVSVAGTYATGAASVVSGLGVLTLGLRNDTLASIYGANAQYTPHTVGAAGEQVVAIAPMSTQVTGIGSCFTGVEQPIITSVAANYIYVTGVQVANASANNVYLSFYGAGLGSVTGSIIGFTVAPANGGSNIVYEVPLKTAIGQGFSASVSGVASVYLSAQGFLSKT